jgi:hypothetical protein
MQKRKFQTSAEVKKELLKQTLLEEMFNSKPYYEDGFYKPSTQKNTEAKTQRQLYDAIDVLGYRLSTPDYYGKSAADISYRTKTDAMGKKILDDMIEQVKSGLMSSQTYNDIIAYFSNMYKTSVVGDSGISIATASRMALLDNNQIPSVQNILQSTVAQNITSNPLSEIKNIEQKLGMSNEDMKILMQSLESQQATDRSQMRKSLNYLGDQIGTVGQSIMTGLNQHMPAVGKDDIHGTNATRQTNIQNNLAQNRTGDADTTTYRQIDEIAPEFLPENQLPANYGQNDAEQRAKDFISRFNKESEEMVTKTYGLPIAVSKNAENGAKLIIEDSFIKNISSNEFLRKLNGFADSIKKKHPSFKENSFITDYLAVYNGMTTSAANEQIDGINLSNSNEARQADIIKEQLNIDKQINDANQGTLSQSVDKNEAKTNSAIGTVPIYNQLSEEVNNATDFITNFVFSVINNTQPLVNDSGIDALKEEMLEPLKLVNIFNEELGIDIQKNDSSSSSELFGRLATIKNMFDSESLSHLIGMYDKTTFQDWQSVKQINADVKKGVISIKDGNMAVTVRSNLWSKIKTALETVRGIYERVEAKYPDFWRLKRMLSSSDVTPNRIYTKFITDSQKSTEKKVEAEGKRKPVRGGTMRNTLEHMRRAEPAPTSQIPDPPMRYTVGSGILRQNKRNHDITIT